MNLRQWNILAMSITVLAAFGIWQEKLGGPETASREGAAGESVFSLLGRQHVTVRFLVCAGMMLYILLFGTYGYGFSAGSFIYGGF